MDIKYTFDNGILNILECPNNFNNDCYDFINKNINTSRDVKEIIFPDNVEYIVKLCHNLIKVKLPWNLKEIPDICFHGCKSLKEIEIPEGVKKIGVGAFESCENLKKVILPSSIELIGNFCFQDCKSLEEIVIPEGVTSVGDYAFASSYINKIILPSSLKSIGENCFSGCKNLEEIVIPDSIEIIPDRTFVNCRNLTNITLPSSLKSIGVKCFETCKSLESIIIPEGAKEINTLAFFHCERLQNVKLPSTLECIGFGAFSNCHSLEEIIIPNGTNIQRKAFEDCFELKNVKLPLGIDCIAEECFCNCLALEEIEIPEGIKEIGHYAFSKCNILEKVKLPSTLRKIGHKAFEGHNALEEIVIPEGVERLSPQAFINCINLKKVRLPSTMKFIGSNCFFACDTLEEIDIPSNCELQEDAFERNNINVLKIDEGPLHINDTTFMSADINKLIYKSNGKEIEAEGNYKEYLNSKKFGLITRSNKPYKIGYCYNGKYSEFDVKKVFSLANDTNRISELYGNIEEEIKVHFWTSKGKFIPHYTVIKNMHFEDVDLFYKNNNCNKWGELVKHSSIKGHVNKESLFKICYALGVFQESGSKRDEAIEFIKEHITSKMDGYRIHAEFDGLHTFNHKYDPMWAEFFMKYYKENQNFMVIFDSWRGMGAVIDLLAASYNNFDLVKEAYPNKVVNTNREADLLLPEHVKYAIQSAKYNWVDEENKELALKVGLYGYTQEQFEELQEWFNQGKNIEEKDLKIFISEDKEVENSVTYELLAKDNPLGAVLGNITNCCQVIGGAGASCVKYGMTMPNSKFMTFNYNKDILGQAWVWYDEKTKVVCLDNIEVPTRYIDKIKHSKSLQQSFVECFKRMASNFISEMGSHDLEVNKVTIGEGYNDIREILNKYFNMDSEATMLRGYDGYSDADEGQYVIKRK